MISITKHEHILADVFLRDDRIDKEGVSETWDDGIRKEALEMKIYWYGGAFGSALGF